MADTLDLGNLLVHLRMNAAQYFNMMNKVERRMRMAADKMARLGRSMTMRVTLPIVAIGAGSVKAFASFDDAMTKSLAIMSGITPQLRKEMESLALELSTNGVTAAKDLAKSYFFLASAGLDARQSMASLKVVEEFAVAGAFDMALATDLATDAQSALGLTVKNAQQNMINMTRVTDVLTGANTLANATTQQFSEALTSQAGPAMKAYGIELEEGVAVLAAYADQGIKAQRAGNMLSRMLRLMTKGFMSNRGAWKQFNIDIFGAAGELKPLHTIIGDLSNVLNAMSTEQKIATLQMLGFQARSQQAILPLLGLQDRIKKYNEELLKMGGITREVVEKQLKSFSSQMNILKNQIVNAGIGIGAILAPAILRLNESIKKLLRGWQGLNESTKKWVIGLALATALIGPLIWAVALLIKTFLLLATGIVTIASLMTGWVGVLVLIIALAYALRAAFIQNFIGIREAWAALLDVFKFGFEWLSNTAIGPFLIAMQKSFFKAFKNMGSNFREFIIGISAMWWGARSYMLDLWRGHDEALVKSAQKYLDVYDKLSIGLKKVAGFVATPFKLAIDGFKLLTKEGLRVLKAQLKADLKSILDFLLKAAPDVAAKLQEAMAAALNEIDKAINKIPTKVESSFDKIGDFFENWAGSAQMSFENISESASRAMDEISESLTDLVMTGKADFNTLANSILRDITRMIIRAQMAKALGVFFGTGFVPTVQEAAVPTFQVPSPGGRGFHSGGLVSANPASFHNGLAAGEVPAVLQTGEYVLSRENVAAIRGGGGGGGGIVNITVQAIDAQGTAQFLENNKRVIASMLQNTMQNNHPVRRFDRG